MAGAYHAQAIARAGSTGSPYQAKLNSKRKRFSFAGVMTHRSAWHSEIDSQPAHDDTQPSLSADDPEHLMVPRIPNPGASVQTDTEPKVHLVFPGSSFSYVPPKDADFWNESEWIEQAEPLRFASNNHERIK
jgi:hypothetical protein